MKFYQRWANFWWINYHADLIRLEALIGVETFNLEQFYSYVTNLAYKLEFVRLLVCAYQCLVDNYNWPWDDVFLSIVNIDHTFSASTFLCLAVFLPFAMTYNYLLHFVVPDRRLFKPLHEAVIETNQAILAQCSNPKTKRSMSANVWALFSGQANAPKIRFAHKMSSFPYLSPSIQLQAFRIFVALEVMLNATFIASASLYLIVFTIVYFMIVNSRPLLKWHQLTFLAGDLAMVHFLSHKLLHYTMSMLASSVYIVYLYSAYLRQLNRMLIRMAESTLDQGKIARHFGLFRREHMRCVSYLLYANQILWKKVTMWAIGCNFPLNVYFVSYLFKKRTGANAMIIGIDIFFQFFLMTIAFIPLGNLCARFHHSKNIFVALQQRLRGRSKVGLKLKMLATYELINCDAKIGITLGDLRVITNSAMFHFMFVYFVYLTQMLNFIVYV